MPYKSQKKSWMTGTEMAAFRHQYDLSQEQLCPLLDRSKDIISRWEREAAPIPKVVAELLRAWADHGIPERVTQQQEANAEASGATDRNETQYN